MITRKTTGAIGLMVLGSVVLLGTPGLAIEPGVDFSAGPGLPSSRADARLYPKEETDPTVVPDVVINEPAIPLED